MFFFPCPACSFRMQSTPDRVGQKVLCPKCYDAITVPDPDAPAIVAEDTFPIEREPELRPASRVARVMAPLATRTMPRNDTGGVVLFQSMDPMSPSDCMTQLTAAITMRMKPPPDPPMAEMKLSTGVWIGLTLLGVVLWVATVIYQGGPLHYVTAIGVVLISIGVGWVAYLAGRQRWWMGVLTLLPPVAIFRLFNGDGRDNHRPLRYVLSGLLLLALVYVNPLARAVVRNAFGMEDHRSELAKVEQTPATKLSQLVGRVDRTLLLDELARLGQPAEVANVTVDQRDAVIAELRRLIRLENRSDIMTGAIQALVVWAGDSCKADLLAAAKSNLLTTRQAALPHLTKWKDVETAKVIAPMLTRREERTQAIEALKSIGEPAEESIGEVLFATHDQMTGLSSINLLEAIGGARSVQVLTKYSQTGEDLILRDIARRKADELAKRKSN